MNKIENLPGWKTQKEEISNSVYHFKCIHPKGYIADVTDHEYDRGMHKCLEGAFEIEQQIGRNRSKFLYDTLLMLTDKMDIKANRFDEEIFGSWVIEGCETRIVFEGRDQEIDIESKEESFLHSHWKTIDRYRDLEKLTLTILEQIANRLK